MVKLTTFVVLVICAWHSTESLHISDIATAVVQTILSVKVNCTNPVDASLVQYWLYTRYHHNNPLILTSPMVIDPDKPIYILIHGWGGKADVDYISAIKDAYLEKEDANIIAVDYSPYAALDYPNAYCHAPAIAINVAQFICTFSAFSGTNTPSIHVIGHSMGAQIAGMAGQETQKSCGTIGRITALDPAGPLYQSIDTSLRLDETDATFVDVIHTNQGQYGYVGSCGHVDFYPNYGFLQPGCLRTVLNRTSIVDKLVDFVIKYIECNHQRSCYLFAESIKNNYAFPAISCVSCGFPVCLTNPFGSVTYMGQVIRSQTHDKNYLVTTHSQSPYGQSVDQFVD